MKKNHKIHDELIVRVVQLYLAEGETFVKDAVPRLWSYYISIFLPAVSQHIEKIKARMFGGWNPDMFKSQSSTTFAFDQ